MKVLVFIVVLFTLSACSGACDRSGCYGGFDKEILIKGLLPAGAIATTGTN